MKMTVEKLESEILLDSQSQAELEKLASHSIEQLLADAKAAGSQLKSVPARSAQLRADALHSAWSFGLRLLAAKTRLPRGGFTTWFKNNKLGISDDTASRYMALAANTAHVRCLPPGTSLRKAYLSIGALRPAAKASPERAVRALTDKLKALKKQIPQSEATQNTAVAKELRRLQKVCIRMIERAERARSNRTRSYSPLPPMPLCLPIEQLQLRPHELLVLTCI